jgi:hypothetical protein
VATVIAIFVAGFLAYFVSSFDSSTGQWFDGVGRRLSPRRGTATGFTGVVSGRDRGGLLADFVWFWGGVALVYGLLKFRDR